MAGLLRVFSSSFFIAALAASAAVTLPPLPDGAAVVIMAPWVGPTSGVELVAAAGGRLLSTERDGFLIRARFEGPAYLSRLYAGGAVLVLRGEAQPCGSGEAA